MYKLSDFSRILIGFLLFTLPIKSQTKSVWAFPIEKCWTYKAKNPSKVAVVSKSKFAAIIFLTEGWLEAIEVKKGKKLWSTELGENFSSPVLVNNQGIYVIKRMPAGLGHQIISIDVESGLNKWQRALNNDTNPDRLTSSFNLLFIMSENGHMLAIDKITKSIVWEKHLNTKVTSNSVTDENNLILGTSKNAVAIISKQNGNILLQINVKKTPTRLFLASGGLLFVGDKQGNVKTYSLLGSKRKWGKLLARTGGEIVGILPLKNSFLIISKDNFAYSVSLRGGNKIWKRKLPGRVIGHLLLDDDTGFFIISGSNIAVFINLSNGEIINRLNIEKDVYFTGPPLSIGRLLLLPTSKGLVAYNPISCKK